MTGKDDYRQRWNQLSDAEKRSYVEKDIQEDRICGELRAKFGDKPLQMNSYFAFRWQYSMEFGQQPRAVYQKKWNSLPTGEKSDWTDNVEMKTAPAEKRTQAWYKEEALHHNKKVRQERRKIMLRKTKKTTEAKKESKVSVTMVKPKCDGSRQPYDLTTTQVRMLTELGAPPFPTKAKRKRRTVRCGYCQKRFVGLYRTGRSDDVYCAECYMGYISSDDTTTD